MYDELVKRIHRQAVYLPEKFSKNAELLDALMKAADAIEQLTADLERSKEWEGFWKEQAEEAKGKLQQYALAVANKPHWIPVTERLPEIDKKHRCSKDVLAYLNDGGMCFTALEESIFGQVGFECEHNPAVEEEMIVTHWMPLPEPPKEE